MGRGGFEPPRDGLWVSLVCREFDAAGTRWGTRHATLVEVPTLTSRRQRNQLERPVAIRLHDGRQVTLPQEPIYSTPELLAVERRILQRAAATRHAGRGVASHEITERANANGRVALADERHHRELAASG